ncbi:hypothetical protein [Neptunomonas phycophila]|uniref:hypothetical protein n=1 Tax=Neptunomonas phycophila TaxID=1572645 RepID=UPI001BE595F6|nr:hypothetical protein [Neptunomonas phycophila]MBT3145446.1 hypothetical protein [Neptunomonas phycophila]
MRPQLNKAILPRQQSWLDKFSVARFVLIRFASTKQSTPNLPQMAALQGKMKNVLLPMLGFLIAPPIGALAWVLIEGGVGEITSGITAWAMVVSIIVGTVLGAPTYIFLSAKKLVSIISLSLGGAIISMLPWVLLSHPGSTTKSIVGQTIIIQNGSYTAEGIIYQIKFIAQFGLCGAISGMVFWLIVRSLVTSKGTGRSKAAPVL